MLPSEALRKILKIRRDLKARPYNAKTNAALLEKAYRDFDESIQNSLLELIKTSDKDSSNHHERLMQPWLNDPEYKKALHQFDHELNQSSKGDK